jgi:hypothetical protein
MKPASIRAHRARVAALSRYRNVCDPELVQAREGLREVAFIAAIERALAAAPPITSAIRAQVLALLPANGDGL